MKSSFLRRSDVIVAIASGVLYGVAAQITARSHALGELFGVMSFGYVFVLPLVIGALARINVPMTRSLWAALLAAVLSALLCLGVAFAVGWEGSICLIMAAPIYLTVAIVGMALTHLWLRYIRPSHDPQQWMLAPLLALPMLTATLESGIDIDNQQLRVVSNTIDIDADPQVVWPQIARVAPIHEPQDSLFFTMGFPRPIAATLSHEGVGGVRHASFERGLLFIETVTEWKPEQAIRFTIDVDPRHTPLTTLDGHVTVGGAYFDVLDGGYRIERLEKGRVRLHLDSQHRISTNFNFYTSLWSDYLMSEIQESILRVIKGRCEAAARATAAR